MFERSAGESRLLEKSKTEETLELSISKASMSTFMNFDIQNPYPKTQKCFFPLIFHLKKIFFLFFQNENWKKAAVQGLLPRSQPWGIIGIGHSPGQTSIFPSPINL